MTEDKSKIPMREEDAEAASRARNRTVMLTPDITGQVRARLQQQDPQESEFTTPTPVRSTAARPEMRPIGDRPAEPPPAPPVQPPVQPPVPPPAPPRVAAPQPASAPKTQLVGFLVSFDNGPAGEYYELRAGRLIVTSDPNSGANNLVIDHETVSPMHAIIRITASGELQILDQLSEHGTIIRRFGSNEEEQLCGDKSALEHGDVIRFGQRSFVVCIVHRGEE